MRTKTGKRPHRMRTFVLGGLAGAAGVYLLDPDRGRSRRTKMRDRIAGTYRRTGRRAERIRRRIEAQTYGARQKLSHMTPQNVEPDDATLKHKIESEILRQTAGRINVEAADGTVVLRGEVDRPEAIRWIEKQVRKMPGVRDVQNLLHLPDTPPPNKQEALRASAEAARRS